jgi:hypothetical protein
MAHPIAALLGALSLLAAPPAPAPVAEARHLFDIATQTGAATSTWAALAYDRAHDELFAAFGGQVHIYNSAAMESYTFGGDGDLGLVLRLGLLESGEMLLFSTMDGRRSIIRADFRGEPLGPWEAKPIPAAFAGFEPDRIVVQGGKVYLVQTGRMRVVVADLDGKVERSVDLDRVVRAKDPEIKTGMNGFWVDEGGNFYFTMPYAFTAFVLSPSGDLRQFGTRGSSPGKFNIVGAVATDEQGNIFVLDRLRSVVMVFDPTLAFLGEFGYRGDGPDNLISPYELVVGNGKIFVSQARERGVKVFHYKPPPRPAPAEGAGGG